MDRQTSKPELRMGVTRPVIRKLGRPRTGAKSNHRQGTGSGYQQSSSAHPSTPRWFLLTATENTNQSLLWKKLNFVGLHLLTSSLIELPFVITYRVTIIFHLPALRVSRRLHAAIFGSTVPPKPGCLGDISKRG